MTLQNIFYGLAILFLIISVIVLVLLTSLIIWIFQRLHKIEKTVQSRYLDLTTNKLVSLAPVFLAPIVAVILKKIRK